MVAEGSAPQLDLRLLTVTALALPLRVSTVSGFGWLLCPSLSTPAAGAGLTASLLEVN